jgi:hypothetical protein
VEGFIASNLHPSNLNGWDSVFCGEPGNAHLTLDQGLRVLQGLGEGKRASALGPQRQTPISFSEKT